MFKYVVKQGDRSYYYTLGHLLPSCFFCSSVPGDPFTSAKLTKEVAANMRSYYGFDKPLIQQYFTYLGELAAWQFRLLYEVHQ